MKHRPSSEKEKSPKEKAARALARREEAERRQAEAPVALREYYDAQQAERDKTERLRALRLAQTDPDKPIDGSK